MSPFTTHIGLVPTSWAIIELPKGEKFSQAVDGLEQFSHIWLVYVFDRAHDRAADWHPYIETPRETRTTKVGVPPDPFLPIWLYWPCPVGREHDWNATVALSTSTATTAPVNIPPPCYFRVGSIFPLQRKQQCPIPGANFLIS